MNEITISLKVLNGNLNIIKKLAGKAKVCAVVKAEAYGHGMIEIANSIKYKVDYFAVSSLKEAQKLKEHNIRNNILILGYLLNYKEAVLNEFEITVGNLFQLKSILKVCKLLNKQCKIHIKKDSGLNRYGYKDKRELAKMLNLIQENTQLINLTGFYTHLVITDEDCEANIAKQANSFEQDLKMVYEKGFNPLVHVASSTTLMMTKSYQYDMVRVGMALYGFCDFNNGLEKVMSIKSKITEIKETKSNEAVGYGELSKIDSNKKIAIVPIGYGYGINSALSNKSHVLIKQQKCKIIGKMSMDCMFVDISQLHNVEVGDDVILIGRQGNEQITATDHAGVLNTYSTEIISQINRARFDVVIQ